MDSNCTVIFCTVIYCHGPLDKVQPPSSVSADSRAWTNFLSACGVVVKLNFFEARQASGKVMVRWSHMIALDTKNDEVSQSTSTKIKFWTPLNLVHHISMPGHISARMHGRPIDQPCFLHPHDELQLSAAARHQHFLYCPELSVLAV